VGIERTLGDGTGKSIKGLDDRRRGAMTTDPKCRLALSEGHKLLAAFDASPVLQVR
jgi:hypothetical protein